MVSDIPYLVVENICRLLNVKSAIGNDFRRLAGELGMKTSNVRLLSQKDNPTDEVLKWWEPQISATVNKFREVLIRMERHDVVEILEGDKQPEENQGGKKYNKKLKFRLALSASGNLLSIVYTHINIFTIWFNTNRVTVLLFYYCHFLLLYVFGERILVVWQLTLPQCIYFATLKKIQLSCKYIEI